MKQTKTAKTQKTYMLLDNWSGEEFSPKFTFNASDDAEARSKSIGWARYHSFSTDEVTFRPATQDEADNANWLHNEYMIGK